MVEPPKELKENRLFRAWVRWEGNNRPRVARKQIQCCRDDILYYVNTFVWQYNPQKKKQEIGPFITWDFQDKAFQTILECIDTGRDLVIEKSREMGASWMCLIVMEWLWHFHKNKKFLCISRNAEAVDCEDPDSLFWKIDFIHKHLPLWLRPRMKRRGMYYGNEENGSTITGQASTGKAGVGGRATAMFVDEFSQIREDYEVLHRTADTTACRIFNFTHTDISNAAAELSRRVDMRKLRLHWSDHPDKRPGLYQYIPEEGKVEVFDKQYAFPVDYHFIMDGKLRSPWYDYETTARGRSARAVAMDLDINPRGSMSQVFDALTIKVLTETYCTPPLWEGELEYDHETAKPLALIPVAGGRLKLWINPKAGGKLPAISAAGAGDIATGSGATPSVLEFLNRKTGEQIAEYVNPHIEPHILAGLAVALCWLFKDEDGEGARFAWERVGPGIIFGKRLLEFGYRNVYYKTNEQKLSPVSQADTPGWYPRPEAKRWVIEQFRAGLHTRQCIVKSAECLDECLSFRYVQNGMIEHAGEANTEDPKDGRVNHGDRATAMAIAWMLARNSVIAKKEEPQENRIGSLAWRRELAEQREREQEVWA